MAKTKRDRAKALNQRSLQLNLEIKRGKKNDLSILPPNYISKKDAMRKLKLSEG